ncbi:DUF998 domain-containing protein [uncultured Vagococcus sp.]|uniref:DUF998 domain-containing protein n=1 Tax=uncultured Vagococcus sp. TaxID=189676 RepID=UPI0028D7B4D1|nr:DUF998 domain-containing protein [uncultured Vagococcus sp.]
MKKEELIIKIPPEIYQDLTFTESDELVMAIKNQGISITKKNQAENQVITLRWFLLPSLLISFVFYLLTLYERTSQVPLTGKFSIASMVITLGLFSGICVFSFFFVKGKRQKKNNPTKNIYWRNFPTILVAFAIILAFVLSGFFWLVGILFKDASFDVLTATFIFFLFTSVINYFMIYFAASISSTMIITLLISVILGGLLFSMLTNADYLWWQHNFSFLGTQNAVNSWQFNITLMISALLMIALIDYLFVSLRKSFPKSKQLMILRGLLTVTAITLGAVGFFPNDGGELHIIHTEAASWLVYLVIILIFSIRWLLPQVTREFLFISYGIGGVLFICNILFSNIHYLSLTAFELIAFIMAFSWILLLLQNLQKLSTQHELSFDIAIKCDLPRD